jgi:ABC-type amino acid transport substrate-binding protein
MVQHRELLTPNQLAQITYHHKKWIYRPFYWIFQEKNGELFLKTFNSGLNKLKESGKYDQMLKDMERDVYDV